MQRNASGTPAFAGERVVLSKPCFLSGRGAPAQAGALVGAAQCVRHSCFRMGTMRLFDRQEVRHRQIALAGIVIEP